MVVQRKKHSSSVFRIDWVDTRTFTAKSQTKYGCIGEVSAVILFVVAHSTQPVESLGSLIYGHSSGDKGTKYQVLGEFFSCARRALSTPLSSNNNTVNSMGIATEKMSVSNEETCSFPARLIRLEQVLTHLTSVASACLLT